MYVALWVFGMLWSVFYQEMDGAKALLWCMSSLTGCGMVNPVEGDFNLLVTAFFCLLGRPLHIYVTTVLSRQILPGQLTLPIVQAWALSGVIWFASGVLFFHFYDNRFTVLEAIFYSAETGFMVGYKLDEFKPRHYNEFLFTSLYLFIGSTLINTGLIILTQFVFTGVSEVVAQSFAAKNVEDAVAVTGIPRGNELQQAMEDEDEVGEGSAPKKSTTGGAADDEAEGTPWCSCRWYCSGWRLPFICFFCLTFLGAQYSAVEFQYTAARSFLYSVSTLTTTGVTNPPVDENSMIFTTCFLILGIPVTAVSLSLMAQSILEWIDPTAKDRLESLASREEQRGL